MSKEFWNEVFIKTLLPSIITVIIGVAVELKKNRKMHWLEIVANFVIGVGTAYLFRHIVHSNYPDQDHATLLISVITVGSYKGWELLYDGIGRASMKQLLQFLLKVLGK